MVSPFAVVAWPRSSHLPVSRQRIGGDLLGLAVDLRGAGLIRHADPDVAFRIEFHAERAFGLILPQGLEGVIGHLADLRIELADELVAKIRIPGMAVRI